MVLSVLRPFSFVCSRAVECMPAAPPDGVLVFPLEGQVALPEREHEFPAPVTGLGACVALLIPVNAPFPGQRTGLDIVHFPHTSPIKTNSSSFWENSSSLEKELKSEKEQRQALQRELQQEKDTSSLLRAELQQVEGLKKVRQLSWEGKSCWRLQEPRAAWRPLSTAKATLWSLCLRQMVCAHQPLREQCNGENKTGRHPAVAAVAREPCQGDRVEGRALQLCGEASKGRLRQTAGSMRVCHGEGAKSRAVRLSRGRHRRKALGAAASGGQTDHGPPKTCKGIWIFSGTQKEAGGAGSF